AVVAVTVAATCSASGATAPGRPLAGRGGAGEAAASVNCGAIGGDGSSFYEDSPTYTDRTDDTPSWKFATPASQGMDGSQLQAGATELAARPELQSYLVMRNGALVFERYFNGGSKQASHNIHSASKSILSAAVGIAIDKGLIKSPDQKLSELLPSYFAGLDAGKQRLSVRHLLTMTGGLKWTEDSTEYQIETQPDWVRAILGQRLVTTPGSTFNYSTGLTHLMSAALTRATGMSTCDFVRRNLFEPLGITAEHWGRDPQGTFSGGCNLFITAREMAKFGQLHLNGGRWNGRQVVPAAWVAQATSRQVDDGGYGYGFNWWLTKVSGHDVAAAWGYNGQFIYLVKDLGLVVVMTTDTQNHNVDFNGESILRDYVVPAVNGR
ncbi:MAG: hypothetical protein JWN46_3108, partial [Acidimicrobiales bacterium]|nr:hypothetical protein [Acidimicrobiales bacterium]